MTTVTTTYKRKLLPSRRKLSIASERLRCLRGQPGAVLRYFIENPGGRVYRCAHRLGLSVTAVSLIMMRLRECGLMLDTTGYSQVPDFDVLERVFNAANGMAAIYDEINNKCLT